MPVKLLRRLAITGEPLVMGIVNVTPDSFSDGGLHKTPQSAVDHACRLIGEGADIVDVGGESTRPGAHPVSIDEELRRVIPVIDGIRQQSDIDISIDTRHARTMVEATGAGATLINDVGALRAEGALEAAAQAGVAVCLMHMQGLPGHMQDDPRYENVVTEVVRFLSERRLAALGAGISADRILLDPGFGFGKTPEHNVDLLAGLERVCELDAPILVGLSRKSMFGALLGLAPEDRSEAGLVTAVLAVQAGVRVIRTHDVGATVRSLRTLQLVRDQ